MAELVFLYCKITIYIDCVNLSFFKLFFGNPLKCFYKVD